MLNRIHCTLAWCQHKLQLEVFNKIGSSLSVKDIILALDKATCHLCHPHHGTVLPRNCDLACYKMELWWNYGGTFGKVNGSVNLIQSDSIWLFQSESINIFLAAQFLFGCFSLCRRNALGKKLPLPRRSTWLFRPWYIRYVLRFVSRFNMKNHVAMQKRWKYSAEVKLSAVTML